MSRPRNLFQGAFTLIELLVVIAIIGILAGIMALNFRDLEKPAQSDTRALAATFKAGRSKAISTTGAVRYTYDAASRTFKSAKAASCKATTGWTNLPTGDLKLQPRVELASSLPSTWKLCFTSRGLADSTPILKLRDKGKTKEYTVSVYLGGAVQVGP